MIGDRYQIRRDVALTNEQVIALRMTYHTLADVVTYARHSGNRHLLYTSARIVAGRMREMTAAFGERKR